MTLPTPCGEVFANEYNEQPKDTMVPFVDEASLKGQVAQLKLFALLQKERHLRDAKNAAASRKKLRTQKT